MNVKKKYAKVFAKMAAGKYEEALKLFDRVRSEDKDSYYIVSSIYYRLKSYIKAYFYLKKILPMLKLSSPEYHTCIYNLAICSSNIGLADENVNYCLKVISHAEDKTIFYACIKTILFNMSAKETITVEDFHAIFDIYRKSLNAEPYPRRFYDHDKIRVGFVSGDFHNHVVMKWSWYLLTELDKKRFAVYCYSNTDNLDEVTKQLRPTTDCWRDIRDITDEAAAKLIRDDEIDILFDLSGHTTDNRLGVFAYRPATVQISGIGFTCSTGLKTVDYFLTDVHCLGDSAPYFVEDFIVMSKTHICWILFSYILGATITEPPCLKTGYVTFGSFNQYRR